MLTPEILDRDPSFTTQTFMRSQLRQHPNPRNSAARKGSNIHAKPTSPTPQPQEQCSTKGVKLSCEANVANNTPPPGATQHARGQTFMRSQLSPTPQPPLPPGHRSTEGVKLSCEANFANTPTPGATQQKRGQTLMRSQLRQHPNPGATQH